MSGNVLAFMIGLITFVGVIVTLVVLASRRFNHQISISRFSRVEAVIIAGILIGTVGLFQPVSMALYTAGFVVLFLSTLCYIVWSHVIPRSLSEDEAAQTPGLTAFALPPEEAAREPLSQDIR